MRSSLLSQIDDLRTKIDARHKQHQQYIHKISEEGNKEIRDLVTRKKRLLEKSEKRIKELESQIEGEKERAEKA